MITTDITNLTFAMIKPDAVAQKNAGKIVDLIEKNDFEIVRLHKAFLAKDLAEEFYAEHKDKPFYNELVEFITSGPVMIMALHKKDAVNEWRKLIGATNPAQADEGTIRKLFGTDIGKNAVHGSLDTESAFKELDLFFSEMFGLNMDENEEEEENEDEDECCDEETCNG